MPFTPGSDQIPDNGLRINFLMWNYYVKVHAYLASSWKVGPHYNPTSDMKKLTFTNTDILMSWL